MLNCFVRGILDFRGHKTALKELLGHSREQPLRAKIMIEFRQGTETMDDTLLYKTIINKLKVKNTRLVEPYIMLLDT